MSTEGEDGPSVGRTVGGRRETDRSGTRTSVNVSYGEEVLNPGAEQERMSWVGEGVAWMGGKSI